MEQKKDTKEPKTKKLADPEAVTIDLASRQMIERAHELGIETAFDRAMTMKPCNIGTQDICCKNCGMSPCRLPLRKGGIEGEKMCRHNFSRRNKNRGHVKNLRAAI